MSSSPNVFDRLAADQEARAALVRATVLELQTNPAYQPYFAGYTPASVAAFIEQYAQRKARYVFDGPSRSQHFEAESTEVQEHAQVRLWDIQQKKLFDLQCRWRAGLFQHPAIHVTDQFDYWSRHPDRCPFLPPITPDELALYLDYLADPDCREGNWSRQRRTPDWQGYMELRATYYEDELALLPPDSHVFAASEEDNDDDWDDEDEDDEEEEDDEDEWDDDDDDQPAYPAWYRFYDQHHGTGHVRHLPNLRGMRQQHYQDLHMRDSWQNPAPPTPPAPAEAPAAEPPQADAPAPVTEAVAEPALPTPVPEPYVPDNRPWLSMYDEATFRMIVETFDPTPGLLELRRAQEQGLEDRDNRESEAALLALHNLANSHLVIPIDVHTADWRLALREAELVLRCRQLARALPAVYDDYCQRQQLGLGQNPPLSASHGDEPGEPWNINYKREQVLHGRELSGEPRNFDY